MKNIVQYDEVRAKLDEVKEICNFIPDVSTDEGYEKSKRVSLDVGKLLTSLEKSRKELKSDSLAFGRKVDADAKEIALELGELQQPHKDAYKELDSLKKEREANRKAELESRVQAMRELPELMRDSDSDGIKAALDGLLKEECLDFYEFTEQALKARNASRQSLSEMFGEKLKQEKEAEELAALRKAQAEREQKEHEDRIAKEAADNAKREAEHAAEQARIEADRKANEDRQRIQQEKEKAEAAEKAAIKEKKDAELRLTQQAEQAEKRRIQAEQQAKIDAEESAKRAQQAEIDRQDRAQSAIKAEQEKREANKRHVGKIRKEAKESLMAVGLTEAQAKSVVLAINAGQITNVTINY